MATITQIKRNIKNKNKVSVFADGEFLCSVTEESAVKSKIKVGDEIDGDRLKTILAESDRETAFQKAVDSVCRSLKTQKQVETYLYGKGYSAEVVSAVVDKMKEYRYVDDGEYVRAYISTYQSKKGKKKICYELKLKGVGQELLEQAESLTGDQTEYAAALAVKFMKNRLPTRENLQKLFRHLAGKGFDFEVVRAAVNSVADTENLDID